jgi:hypothetical protein
MRERATGCWIACILFEVVVQAVTKKNTIGLEYSSVVNHLPRMLNVLSTKQTKES